MSFTQVDRTGASSVNVEMCVDVLKIEQLCFTHLFPLSYCESEAHVGMHQLSLHPDARIFMHWLVAAFRFLLLHADEKSAVIVAGGLSTASRPRCVASNSARIDLLYCQAPILSHLHHHMFLTPGNQGAPRRRSC